MISSPFTLAWENCHAKLTALSSNLRQRQLAQRMMRAASWSLLGVFATQLSVLVSSIIAARYVGGVVYGEWGVVRTTIGVFTGMIGAGLGTTASKHIAELRARSGIGVGSIISLSLIAAIVLGGFASCSLLALAPWLAEHSLANSELAGPLRIGAIVLAASSLVGAETGILSGFEKFRETARANILVALVSFPICVFGAIFGALHGMLLSWLIATTLSCLSNGILIRNTLVKEKIRVPILPHASHVKLLWTSSLPASISALLVAPVNWLCCAFLVNQNGGYSEMGVYAAANQWRAIILLVPGAISPMMVPLLANLRASNSKTEHKQALIFSIVVNICITASVAILITSMSPLIMARYGDEFQGRYLTLICLSLAAVLASGSSVIGHALTSSGKMWSGCLLNLSWAIVASCLARIMVHRGAEGLALSVLLSYAMHAMLSFVYARTVFRENHRSGSSSNFKWFTGRSTRTTKA